MSAGSNLSRDVSNLTTLSETIQAVQDLYAALRGGAPVINAQGDPADQAVDLGSATYAWDTIYAAQLALGGNVFDPVAAARAARGVRAELDYVWNGVHPDDLDDEAVIWLDGSVTGDHDVAAMVDDSVTDFRLLLFTTGRDTSNNRISGTNAQQMLPNAENIAGNAEYEKRVPYQLQRTDIQYEFYGSWKDFQTTAGRSWTRGFEEDATADYITTPNGHWRRLTRTAGQSFVVTLGEEGARGTSGNPGGTRSRITIGGSDVWSIARIHSGNTISSEASGPINGACLLVPLY